MYFTTTLINHVNEHIEDYDQTPETITADAGYGSEENYTDLEDKNITAFVKHHYFHKEQQDKKKGKTNPNLSKERSGFWNEYSYSAVGVQANINQVEIANSAIFFTGYSTVDYTLDSIGDSVSGPFTGPLVKQPLP